jgi:hypothetical protein
MVTVAAPATIFGPTVLLTLAVAALMLVLGICSSALELRRQTLRCGSCGRRFDGVRCPRCAP